MLDDIKRYKTLVCTATATPGDLKHQYGQLRYKSFSPDDPNLNMDVANKVELDQFDEKDTTLYTMVTYGSDNPLLVSAMRLIPTVEEYELEAESYSYMTRNIVLPKSSDTWEGNRWAGRSSRTFEGKVSTGLLLMLVYNTAKEYGFSKLIGVQSTTSENWHNKRKTTNNRKSELVSTERDKDQLVVSEFDIDINYHDLGKKMFTAALVESAATSNPFIAEQLAV